MSNKKKDKKKKDYEIIKNDDSKKIKSFQFGNIENDGNKKNQSENTNTQSNSFHQLNLSDITNKKNKSDRKTNTDNFFDKKITKKVWRELRKEEAEKYKQISEDEKEKFIQNMFGTDRDRPKICFSCGKEMKTNYNVFSNKNGNDKIYVCSICIYNRNKCNNCGLPIISNNSYQKLCNYCKPNGKCDCCGKEYDNKDLSNIIDVKGAFCKDCLKDLDKCFNCGKPVPEEEKVILNDDRILCPSCNEDSLLNEDLIKSSYRDTINIINRIFGIKGHLNCGIFVIPSVKKINKIKGDALDYNCKYSIKNGNVYLIVPLGIRQDHLIGLIAGEYAKIIAPKLNPKLKETNLKIDFIFWIKHLILRMRGYSNQFFRLRDGKVESSRFYKWINTNERSKGAKTVFSKIRDGDFKY